MSLRPIIIPTLLKTKGEGTETRKLRQLQLKIIFLKLNLQTIHKGLSIWHFEPLLKQSFATFIVTFIWLILSNCQSYEFSHLLIYLIAMFNPYVCAFR